MTPDLILGPPGVLPPGEWAVGARIHVDGDYGGVFVGYRDCDEGALVRVADDGVEYLPLGQLCLDLTTGPLDFGVRALWSLLDLGEQPLTAPAWVWVSRADNDDRGEGWRLDDILFIQSDVPEDAPGVLYDDYVHVPEITHGDARCALSLALEAVAQAVVMEEVQERALSEAAILAAVAKGRP